MNALPFLAEWALRSSILIVSGALLLRMLRVKDPAIRLAAWTAMLCGSLAIPALTPVLPPVQVTVMRAAPARMEATVAIALAEGASSSGAPVPMVAANGFDWQAAAVRVYGAIALTLLLRVGLGLILMRKLLRGSRATGEASEGVEIRESDAVATPVTLGIFHPAIVLPADWRSWEGRKLDAVLAHERSHARRLDPVAQVVSTIHRALLWYSPLSWFLHRRIVQVAEEASDDAAVEVTSDRPLYAQVLLDFMQVRGTASVGVPMARYGSPDDRIQRILDGTMLSRGVTRWSIVAVVASGAPLAYLAAAAHPQKAPEVSAAPVHEIQSQAAAPRPNAGYHEVQPQAQVSRPGAAYIVGLGTAMPSSTVTVRPQVDGQLMTVDFKEGDTVQAGQLLATIDPRQYESAVSMAQNQLAMDQSSLNLAHVDLSRYQKLVEANAISGDQVAGAANGVARLEGQVKVDQANLDRARLQLSSTRILAPIAGATGLRQIDPGNLVHASDAHGIVTITQVRPMAVVFTIPEDDLPRVLARLREGASLTVEAWNRGNSAKIATGRLAAVDNQIETETGMAKLKAVFDNQDGALLAGQFVNVRLIP